MSFFRVACKYVYIAIWLSLATWTTRTLILDANSQSSGSQDGVVQCYAIGRGAEGSLTRWDIDAQSALGTLTLIARDKRLSDDITYRSHQLIIETDECCISSSLLRDLSSQFSRKDESVWRDMLQVEATNREGSDRRVELLDIQAVRTDVPTLIRVGLLCSALFIAILPFTRVWEVRCKCCRVSRL